MILLRFLGISIFVVFTNAQSVCNTSLVDTGICIPAKECSVVVDILLNSPKPIPQKTVDYLNINYCGLQNNTHYICCSTRELQNSTSTPIILFNENSNKEVGNEKEEEIKNVEMNNVADHPNLNLLPLSKCGFIMSTKIISNGNRILLGEFPWMVMLQYKTPKGLAFQCGGSLISSRYVLTAAHCVTGNENILVSVRLGEHNTSSEIDCESLEIEPDLICADPVQDIEIEEVLFHPQYNKPRFANDIALIRLKREVNLTTEFIQAICLPVTEASQRQKLDRAIIAGWGLTENQQTSDVLLKGNLPVISNDECQNVFKRFQISNSQICAGGENMVDSCKGDSGGPLMYPGKIANLKYASQYVQYGVTSAGASGCGSPRNFSSIFTKVSFYIDWNLDQIKP